MTTVVPSPSEIVGSEPDGAASTCEIQLDGCRRELATLLNLAYDLGTESDTTRLLQRALEHAVRLLEFRGGLIWRAESGTANLRLAGAVSIPPSLLAATPAELEPGTGVSGEALARRQATLMSIDAWRGPDKVRAALAGAGVRTLLGIPLLAHGQAMGAMVLIATKHVQSDLEKEDLAAMLGTVVGVALLHAREHAALIQKERLAALGTMAAGMVHELKNPLTVFLARATLLRHSAAEHPVLDAQEVARAATKLEDAADQMKRIVDSLSLYSKPPKAEAQTLEAALLLTTTFEMLTFSARKAGVQLTVDMPTPGLRLLGDRSHLLQVLLNLATNAIEAVGSGGLVTLAARPGEERDVIFEVADNGPGIPPEVQARIWEPFFTTKAEGTGLGLAVVRSLVEEMGGTIVLEGRPRRGTMFRLSFPSVSGPSETE